MQNTDDRNDQHLSVDRLRYIKFIVAMFVLVAGAALLYDGLSEFDSDSAEAIIGAVVLVAGIAYLIRRWRARSAVPE
jgi:predicted tellurium resistance membrane protein TerC